MFKRPFLPLIILALAMGCGSEKTDRPSSPTATTTATPTAPTAATAPPETAKADLPVIEGDVFQSISFAEALAKAKAEDKLVFIDFYTDWCPPCKMLERTTWKDAKVKAWLAAHTVPIKINAEEQEDLAAQYSVEAYPTLIFINTDASVKEQMEGYRKPEDFLTDAKAILEGKDAMARAKEKVMVKGQDNPEARQEYGETLAEAGRHAEALKEFLWCFDEGLKFDPDYASGRLISLLYDICDLGNEYPPAVEALRQRRDTLRQGILDGTAIPEGTPPPKEDGVWALFRKKEYPIDIRYRCYEFNSLNAILEENDQTVELYEQLCQEQPASPWIEYLEACSFEMLYDAEKYEEIASTFKLAKMVDLDFITYEKELASSPQSERDSPDSMINAQFAGRIEMAYRVYLATGQDDAAAQLADRIINFHNFGDDPDTYNALAWAAHEVGHVSEVNLQQAVKAMEMAEAREDFDSEQYAAIVDTYACVLGDLGMFDEAFAAVIKARAITNDPEALNFLDDTDAWLKEQAAKAKE